MNPMQPATDADEQLVAYLDGELPADEQVQLERRLADDASFRARLADLQRAWDMLDALDRTEADEEFTRTTVEIVAIKAEGDAKASAELARRRRSLLWVAAGLATAASTAIGYFLFSSALDRPNRQLVRDLPVIERVDEYRHAESVDFLQQLRKQGLFKEDVNDAL